MSKSHEIHRYRTLFLSDLHLGTRGCQAHLILDMLRHVEADTIYLVGDIIDGWRLRSGWYWPQTHNDVVQKLLRKVRRGARMVFVPGNHDEFARQFFGLTFGGHRDQAAGDPCCGRRQALPRHPRRRIRRRRPPLEVARLLRRLGLRFRAVRQHPFQRRAPGAGPALLVVFGLGEAQGQERGQFHRLVRARARSRSQEARRRRRGLRPHPSPDHPGDGGRDLRQHRRLRRIVLAGGRALGRPVRSAALEELPCSSPRGSRTPSRLRTKRRDGRAEEAQAEAA